MPVRAHNIMMCLSALQASAFACYQMCDNKPQCNVWSWVSALNGDGGFPPRREKECWLRQGEHCAQALILYAEHSGIGSCLQQLKKTPG